MTDNYQLLLGDCLEILPTLEANSADSIVCDPPYGLSFMGKDWDHGVPGVPFWEAALRVAKPGAMLLAFAGTRTHHRLMVAIEDAGWEIRDCLMWLYGSGFPKSMDIGKAIDKAAGAEREVIGKTFHSNKSSRGGIMNDIDRVRYDIEDIPATDAAYQWNGWGTALKPAWEPIVLAMKPLDGTFANNALVHGVAGLNVDGCRIPLEPIPTFRSSDNHRWDVKDGDVKVARTGETTQQGRWPANLLLDEEAAAMLGEQSRFFYVAKASRRDRNEGLEGMPEQITLIGVERHKSNPTTGKAVIDLPRANHHPTVKPTQLMRYLCRLVTPPAGVILDHFVGSGSTGKAAILEGFRFIGIEKDAGYFAIAQKRIERAATQPVLLEATYDPG